MSDRTCAGCGVKIVPHPRETNPRRWCSERCRVAATRPRRPAFSKCAGCETLIAKPLRGATKKWCSPECRHAATYVPKPREFPPVDRTCVACGCGFVANSPVAQYCSETCRRDLNRDARRAKEARQYRENPAKFRKPGSLSRAQRSATLRLAKAARGTNGGKTVLVSGRCLKCGARFTTRCPVGSVARYCSGRCSGKGNPANTKANRRAREKEAFVEEVDRLAVFDRDGWVCGICAEPVNPDAKFPDLMSASLDHIIPLARGGLHEMSNCQLAHFICNSRKSDRIEIGTDMVLIS